MSQIKKAVFFSVLAQHSTQFISLISISILARLLTPEEIGVFAIASAISFLAIELRAMGANQYLVREKKITKQKIKTATGLMIIVSWGLFLIIVASATFVADFYNEEAIAALLWIIAPTFILAPFSAIPSALITREMEFIKLFKVKFFSNIIGASGTITLVLLGYSYYSLAWGTLIVASLQFMILTYYRPNNAPWLPSFKNIKDIAHFGVFTSSGMMLNQTSQSIPDLVLGKLTTMAEVGLFSRGMGLILFLNKIIILAVKPVVLPHLSAVKRGGQCVSTAYLNAIVLQSAFSIPMFAIVNQVSLPMIRTLFGEQWDFSAPIASTLALWAILTSIHCYSSQVLIAVHCERLMFVKELVIFFTRACAVIFAAPYGLETVAWAVVASGVIELLIKTLAIKSALNLSVLHIFKAFIPTFFVASSCWIVLQLLKMLYDVNSTSQLINVPVIGVSMIVVWMISMALSRHPAWLSVVNTYHEKRGRKKS